MQDHPNSLLHDDTYDHPNAEASLRDRFARATKGLDKPKSPTTRRSLKPITNDEKRERLLVVQQLVDLGMAVEQMVDFLPTWAYPLSRTTLYGYLDSLRLPRSYKMWEGQQSHHDYFTFRFFLRIAHDAHAAGYQTRRLEKGRAAPGARFRPDFSWEILHYLFYLELQLSDLPETRWAVKFANYHRLRKLTGRRFRALFVIDQKGDLTYVRRGARAFLQRHGLQDSGLFLFISLDDLKGSANVATDPVWMTPRGNRTALLEWLPQLRPKAYHAVPANSTSVRSTMSETWSAEDHPSPTVERAAPDVVPPSEAA